MLFPQSENISQYYSFQLNQKQITIYWILIFGFVLGGLALPFLYFDVSIKSSGIIRPVDERTEIRPHTTGIIDSIYYSEGQLVPKGSVVLRLRNQNFGSKKLQATFDLDQRKGFIHDLQLLTTADQIDQQILSKLQSPLYKQQISRFLYRQAEHLTLIKKAQQELHMDSILLQEKVIAPKEMFDKVVENERLQAAFSALKQEQLSQWQQELSQYRQQLAQTQTGYSQLIQEQTLYEVRAPITGVLQGIHSKYVGGLIQAGETIGSLSPEGNVIAECFVTPRDVGLLRIGQDVKFQVDAFDHNYFGTLSGKLMVIDNDFTVAEGRPVFKIRCAFDSLQLNLKNGFTGNLKKGMTVQARFIVARRTLWQLLWDKLDDWLNPVAAIKTT